MARRRYKIPYKKSQRIFRKTASLTHKRNLMTVPMRGGISI